MHKNIYASGFLYHIPSHQILLQKNSLENTWSLFNGIMHPDESSKEAFQRIILLSLNKPLSEEIISDIYDYDDPDLKKTHTIMYAELDEVEDFTSQNNIVFTWVKVKNIYKLPLPEQMKHNITVGQRVIQAKERSLIETAEPEI